MSSLSIDYEERIRQMAAEIEQLRIDRDRERLAREEADKYAQEERMAKEQERLAREEADKYAQEERMAKEQERLAREEADKYAQEERMAKEQERLAREIAEDKSRDTTLCEFLELCHEHFTRQLTVESNQLFSTSGGIGSPVGNKCPDRLEPWTDFIDIQKATLTQLFAMYPMDNPPKIFNSKKGMSELGKLLFDEAIASEKDLEIVLKPSIINPVRRILTHLKDIPPIADHFELDGEITFKGHKIPEAKSEFSRLPSTEQLRVPFTPPQKSTSSKKTESNTSPSTTGVPDWLCFYSHKPTNTRLLVLILEYKPPHKLTVAHLRHGLRPMDIHEIEDKSTYALKSQAPDMHFQEQADLRVATVVTQAYTYMIDSTLEHGIISTGQGFVFLKIDYKTPNIVYYHLSIPRADIAAQRDLFPDNPAFFHRTAVCQVLAFTLHALKYARYKPDQQMMIRQANKLVKKWQCKPDTERFKNLPETPEKEAPGSEYRPSAFRIEVGDEGHRMITRGKLAMQQLEKAGEKGKKIGGGERGCCSDLDDVFAPNDQDSDDPDNNAKLGCKSFPTNTQFSMASRNQNSGGAPRSTSGKASNSSKQIKGNCIVEREYCTQKCLWGLVRGRKMDTECPNYECHVAGYYFSLHLGEHHRNEDSITPLSSPISSRSASPLPPPPPTTHPLSPSFFLPALTAQLACDPDTDILPIYHHTSSHAGFLKISLRNYGYTIIAKGVPSSLERQLHWEEEIYQALEWGEKEAWGWGWCGGLVVLEREEDAYHFDIGMKLTRFLILSHCGLALDSRIIHPTIGKYPPPPPSNPEEAERLVEQAKESMREIHRRGVLHGDVRAANLVWDKKRRIVGIIDFGRGEIVMEGNGDKELSPRVKRRMRDEVERVGRIVKCWVEGGNLIVFG